MTAPAARITRADLDGMLDALARFRAVAPPDVGSRDLETLWAGVVDRYHGQVPADVRRVRRGVAALLWLCNEGLLRLADDEEAAR